MWRDLWRRIKSYLGTSVDEPGDKLANEINQRWITELQTLLDEARKGLIDPEELTSVLIESLKGWDEELSFAVECGDISIGYLIEWDRSLDNFITTLESGRNKNKTVVRSE